MTAYELGRLNDKEFEALASHMVGTIIGFRVERFKPGKDKGVDGRFFVMGEQEGIIQCKHWERSGIAPLLAYLKKTESPKVTKLNPARYILVTSVPLNRADKQAISVIFSPHIKSQSDIFGNEDIQDFLRDHTEIVRKHYKLWLASSEVLTLIFNAPIIGRSSFKMEEIVAFAPKYVTTPCHDRALRLLDAKGSIIIVGDPGVGKSTLAEQLVLPFAANGYELCVIQNSLEEAEGVWANGKKQIFYFDDFLGRNYLEAISRNHDSHILAFMRRVQKDKTKRFILTSRTTIMRQGKSLSDLFRGQNIDEKEFEVRITDLSGIERAQILYNHIWFGDLGPAFVEELYLDRRYREIVSHKNFNPRLVAFITDSHKIAGVEAGKYWGYIKDTLDDPKEVWRGVFEYQLDRLGRLIVCIVVFHGGSIPEAALREACERARKNETPEPSAAEWGLSFERSFQISVGSIVTRTIGRIGEVTVGLFNPSVGDYILHRFSADRASLEYFLGVLRDKEALIKFEALRRNEIVSVEDYRAVIKALIERFWVDPTQEPVFVGVLASLVLQSATLAADLEHEIQVLALRLFDVMDASTEASTLIPLAKLTLEEKLVPPDCPKWEEFVVKAKDGIGDDSTLIELSQVVVLLAEPIRSSASAKLSEHVVDCWKDKISQEVSENGVATEYVNQETDFGKVESEVEDFVRRVFDDYSIAFDDDEISSIVAMFDIWVHINENRNSYAESEGSGGRGSGIGFIIGSEQEQIDDLFERDR